MVLMEELYTWIRENTTLSDSSVYKYTRAVNTVSTEMQQKGIIPTGLFDMSVLECDFYLPIILKDADFVKKNTTGNNMYSNALKQYRMFRVATSDKTVEEKELENKFLQCGSLNETERTAVIKSRIGQGLFRQRLLEKYEDTCIITGIKVKKLLVASHIKPWAVCDNEERLSAENGLLLSPTYDRLFDYGLITFKNDGRIVVSDNLTGGDKQKLCLSTDIEYDLKISTKMKENLEYHRDVIFVKR